MRLLNASRWLALAAAGLYLLGAETLPGAPQEGSHGQPPSVPRRAGSIQRTWASGPASTAAQTEVVQPPAEAPPRVRLPYLHPEEEENRTGGAATHSGSPPASRFLTQRSLAARHKSKVTANVLLPDDASALDPEAERIQEALDRLRHDAGSRRSFYDELRRTIERVRAGLPDEESASPASPHPASFVPPGNPGEPPQSPVLEKPDESPPANPWPPEASGNSYRGTLERAAYIRVIRWARANGAPVPLALGVAWIESHLRTYPPRGSAGEVGMFQILPARCRAEGLPPSRLKEPEFNAWLGTLLLARYYREEGTWARAAAKYVAGPGVFERDYSEDLWAYINWYASSVESYAGYFSRYQSRS